MRRRKRYFRNSGLPGGSCLSHDSKWTAEAVFNLLDNAVKYTPAGGAIRISVEQWEMYVKLSVSDTGKGISESNQAAIFRRFYREEEVHEQQGVGIGLYLTREIVTGRAAISKWFRSRARVRNFPLCSLQDNLGDGCPGKFFAAVCRCQSAFRLKCPSLVTFQPYFYAASDISVTFGFYNVLIKKEKEHLIMNVLQTIDLKKYYGSEPNITRAWMASTSLWNRVSLWRWSERPAAEIHLA